MLIGHLEQVIDRLAKARSDSFRRLPGLEVALGFLPAVIAQQGRAASHDRDSKVACTIIAAALRDGTSAKMLGALVRPCITDV